MNIKVFTFLIRRKSNTFTAFAIICFFLVSGSIGAQEDVDISNPQATINNHLYFLQDDSFDPGLSSLSFSSDIDSSDRKRLAKRLKQIYDGRGLYLQIPRIPKSFNYKDSLSGSNLYFPFPEELPSIYVEKIDSAWLYSERTVKAIPKLFKESYPYGMSRLVDMMPDNKGNKILGLYLWQYFGIILLHLLAFILYFFLSKMFNFIFSRTLWRSSLVDEEKKILLSKVDRYLVLSFLAYIIMHLIPILRLPVKFSVFSQNIVKVLLAIFLMRLGIKLIDVLRSYFTDLTLKTESRLDEQLLPILIKLLKILVVIITTFRILHILDVNITALIAGISIGGLALALAAQDTVKNLIGSAMIFFDKPFQIGDYIMSGDIEGSVVEVGFRSTRIKKSDTSITSVPNGKIADTSLTNLGVRNLRLFKTNLGLMYNTPSDKIKSFIFSLRNLVDNREDVFIEGKYIYLNNLGPSSIDILFRVYIDTNDYAEELRIKEEITFKILEIAEEVGVSFAFPSSSIYIEQLPKQS